MELENNLFINNGTFWYSGSGDKTEENNDFDPAVYAQEDPTTGSKNIVESTQKYFSGTTHITPYQGYQP